MDLFKKNIQALRTALNPGAADALIACHTDGPPPHIQYTKRGQPFFRVTAHGHATNAHSPVNPSAEARKLLSMWLDGGEDTLLLLGLGCGYLLEALAAAPNPPRRVIAVERNPATLAAGLAHFDVSTLPVRTDLMLLIGDTASPGAISGVTPPVKIVPYPALFDIDEDYYAPFARQALALERRAAPPGGRLRIHVIKFPTMFENVFETIKDMGHDPTPVLPGLELTSHLAASKPDTVFSLNYYPSVAVACRGLGIPYACLCISSLVNETLLAPHSAWDGSHIFTFDNEDALKFRGAGHPNVFHLPLGADTRVFHPAPRDPALPEMDVSFVGTSMHANSNDYRDSLLPQLERALRDADNDERRRVLAGCRDACNAAIEAQNSDPFTFRIPEIIAANPVMRAAMSGVFSDAELARLPVILSKESSMRKRLRVIETSAQNRQVTVYGDTGWRDVFAGNPNVNVFGIIPYTRCADVYNASRVNLNVAHIHAPGPVAQRVFDIIACNAFLLSERTADLCNLFAPDTEIGVYSSYGELREKLDYFLDNPDARAAAAAAAYRKLLSAHTMEHRLTHIFSHLFE